MPNEVKKPRRKLRNFLLMPQMQMRLGFYTLVLATFFFTALVGIVYLKMNEILSLVVQLTDAENEVQEVLFSYVQSMSWWIIFSVCLYVVVSLFVTIWYTHKLVGPSYAFRRHVKALIGGDMSARTKLRNGDAFGELADDLNLLSEKLASNEEMKFDSVSESSPEVP